MILIIPNDITIWKELKVLPQKYICDILLENGVVIHVRDDGSADGEDGKTYYAVSQDNAAGNCEILGYSSEITAPIDEITEFTWYEE
ncbi:MAG TPA: hypothetical protein DDY98_01955 [Ruminococcaceae bacterium]|nr:hypothetical protein [Oscillospiraceae bacterium]